MMEHLPLMIVNSVPHRMMRYDSTGDWFPLSDVLHFTVSRMDFDKELETLLHEIFEWGLCEKAGITAAMVDAWDFAHPKLEDPGSHSDCPYREQHMKAMRLSKFVVKKMGYQWKDYDKDYNTMADKLSEEWEAAHGDL